MTARTSTTITRPLSALAAVLFALALAFSFALSGTALAQEEEEGGDEQPGLLDEEGEPDEGDEDGLDDGTEDDGTGDDGFDDGTGDDGFDDEGFDDGTGDDQVDAPVGGAEAGFGGLDGGGQGPLMPLFALSMLTIAAAAGFTYYRKVNATV